MKTRFILISVLLLALLFAGLGVNYLLSLQKVSFVLEDNTDSIVVYNSEDKEIAQLSSDGQISVKSGEYYLVPGGENISSDKIPFSVGEDEITVVVRPPYTKEFLEETLKSENKAIRAAITAKYPDVFSSYTLGQGALYERGEWYGGLLKPEVSNVREQRDPYRVVLNKESGEWKIIRRPEYILTSSRYQEVPINVLREINLIVGE